MTNRAVFDCMVFLQEAARPAGLPREVIDELYLSTLSRYLSEKERAVMMKVFEDTGDDQQAAVEYLLWALLNRRGFVYHH
jgi:hypothetical protein